MTETAQAATTTSYTFGFNNGGTKEHEVLRVIAMILNAPEL